MNPLVARGIPCSFSTLTSRPAEWPRPCQPQQGPHRHLRQHAEWGTLSMQLLGYRALGCRALRPLSRAPCHSYQQGPHPQRRHAEWRRLPGGHQRHTLTLPRLPRRLSLSMQLLGSLASPAPCHPQPQPQPGSHQQGHQRHLRQAEWTLRPRLPSAICGTPAPCQPQAQQQAPLGAV